MGIISRPRSHPALVRAIARWFAVREVDAVPLDELRDTLVPEGLASRDPGSVWADTIAVADELGLLVVDQVTARVGSPDLRPVAGDTTAFRAQLRRVVFSEENAGGLWTDADGKWSSDKAKEFARIAVWMFEQDPIAFQARGEYDAARKAVLGPDDGKLIENPEQLRQYQRWAEALGLAESLWFGGDDLFQVADCTAAVADAVVLAADGKWSAASTVRKAILDEVPVVRGGRLAAGAPSGLLGDGDDGPGVRHALQRLVTAEWLKTDVRSDARSIAVGFDDARATHFRWLRTAKDGEVL